MTHPHPYRPAAGLLRLSLAEVEELQRLYGLLCAFLVKYGGEAKLEIVIKQGKPRFCRLDLPASGELPQAGIGRLGAVRLIEIDAKVSSLCAFTEGGGEARLRLGFDTSGRMEARMVISRTLAVAH